MAGIFTRNSTGILYSLFYGGQFVLLGVQLPFLAGWLSAHSFSAAEIGWITGAALIARLLLGPVVAFWADHCDDERTALRAVSFLFALGALAMALAPSKIIIAFGAMMILWTFGLLVPLTDTAVLSADRNGRLHYGKTRAAGSAFFLTTTIAGGLVLGEFGIEAVAMMMAAAAIFTFLVSLILPHGAGAREGGKPVSWREAPKLLANPVFLAVIISAGLTQGAHAVYYAFSYLRWEALGYSDFTIGLLWAMGVIAEIFLLTRARSIARKLPPALLLFAGACAAALRWFITALEPPLGVLFAVQLLHALTFAAAYLGGLEFLMRAAPTRLVNTGMTLMSATGVGAITGIATVVAGNIWESAGPASAYFMMSAMGGFAAATAIFVWRKWDGGRLFG
ncbi:MAG: MFS transporter [Marinicaulis sp.]|nr:MFS transporter [Marinicaulis sp.]NNE40414.1 MFS transporter [Marinicaulis sp.]NNL89766.1 MFS transporter [Marinicaulis sp.]